MLIPARRKLLGSQLRHCEGEALRMRQLNKEYCKGLFKSLSQNQINITSLGSTSLHMYIMIYFGLPG